MSGHLIVKNAAMGWQEGWLAMTDGVYSLDEIKGMVYPALAASNVRKAVLFGSYAKGGARPESDIDLVVDSGLRGLGFVGLIGEITDAVGKTVDLIDVAHIEPGSRFEKEIAATGVTIYEK